MWSLEGTQLQCGPRGARPCCTTTEVRTAPTTAMTLTWCPLLVHCCLCMCLFRWRGPMLSCHERPRPKQWHRQRSNIARFEHCLILQPNARRSSLLVFVGNLDRHRSPREAAPCVGGTTCMQPLRASTHEWNGPYRCKDDCWTCLPESFCMFCTRVFPLMRR